MILIRIILDRLVVEKLIRCFINQNSFSKLIQELTHCIETSSSFIELLAVIFTVGLAKQCPVFGIFDFQKFKRTCFKRRIQGYDIGTSVLLTSLTREFDWNSLINENINAYAETFTAKLIEICDRAIPNKGVTTRPLCLHRLESSSLVYLKKLSINMFTTFFWKIRPLRHSNRVLQPQSQQ